jgi:plasmid stabilization system protein ParE
VTDFLFHSEAQEEYESARAWYRERSPRAAARFEAEMERVLKLIGENPESFPHYDDDHSYVLMHRFPYCVVYQVQSAAIFIVAIAHGRRAPGYWRGRN